MRYQALVAMLLLSLLPNPTGAAPPETALGDLSKVGAVDFPTSCDPRVQPEFERGVALLHSFFYAEARRVFTAITEQDPACAMAHWGVAMTWYHPIWTPPTEEEMKAGLAAVERAERAGAKTERERDYIAAIASFYRAAPAAASGPVEQSCHGPTDPASRKRIYTEALARLHDRHPGDPEAAAFYSLGLIKANPTPDEISIQLKAAAILESLWKKYPDHPGVVHYLIHAYDYPSLATRGLPAADRYAQIAPWVPHALHMPSHIYTRLGMWGPSIASNSASSRAAQAYAAKYHPDAASFEDLHALDYLVYAHLQRAEDAKAKAIVDSVAAIRKSYPEADFVVAYAVGAIPARYALERHAWQEAASLPAPAEGLVGRFPFDAAHVEFARALGRVRTGDLDGARRALARMIELRDATTDARFQYFRRQMELQRLAASGWLAQAEGHDDEALALLLYAADQEDALGKNPVSPGNIYPIRELLGDLLLEMKRPAEALTHYERSLEINPGRFTGAYGAGRAAELSGKSDVARKHYEELLELARAGDGKRPELDHAKAFQEGESKKASLKS